MHPWSFWGIQWKQRYSVTARTLRDITYSSKCITYLNISIIFRTPFSDMLSSDMQKARFLFCFKVTAWPMRTNSLSNNASACLQRYIVQQQQQRSWAQTAIGMKYVRMPVQLTCPSEQMTARNALWFWIHPPRESEAALMMMKKMKRHLVVAGRGPGRRHQ